MSAPEAAAAVIPDGNNELEGTKTIAVIGKGNHRLIKIFPGHICDNYDRGVRDGFHIATLVARESMACAKCVWTVDHLYFSPQTQTKDVYSD
ncbi:unnamed protein product [Clonostachys chloroleuca]|uniref:Uncharacterized protein n=1 Tax=Clonostachys chloroleuca TaxID=1926264 RepID=A0AA35VBK4_9HYPO|nr:unnamed protein product [Clonostachys chloroleuca]